MNYFLRAILVLLVMTGSPSLMAVERTYSLAEKLVIIVNSKDPESQKIADYYQKKRNIPDEHIIVVEFSPKAATLNKVQFQKIYQQVQDKTPKHVQFYALAWRNTFRVSCMSITSAFAFGFDEKYCAKGCMATQSSPYFNVRSRAPFDDFKIRPTMMLAGSSIEQVLAMIDRGVRSDGQYPDGTAYLMSTTDKHRNTRAGFYAQTIIALGEHIKIQQVNANSLEDKDDVMFYFIGLVRVENIDSNHFMDGAMADHLTSAGGILSGTKQMSLLRWLDAGATASYGTVTEPCSFPQKFPHPGIAIENYLQGNSLIEAYWKSVAWPGQGLFVGEPLASPFVKSLAEQEEI
ncbi:MAG: TIGR03790 family protein [Gammaproteobacteria bacterium]|nr:TIGR03790 family protein [Gammaproteobacteria bacterium]MCK5263344.1 TIGR03790 family protein [Gammaproteobacteria bacterium]